MSMEHNKFCIFFHHLELAQSTQVSGLSLCKKGFSWWLLKSLKFFNFLHIFPAQLSPRVMERMGCNKIFQSMSEMIKHPINVLYSLSRHIHVLCSKSYNAKNIPHVEQQWYFQVRRKTILYNLKLFSDIYHTALSHNCKVLN